MIEAITILIETVSISILVAWFVLSVLNQFYSGKWIVLAKRFDFLHVIPIWTFFAPNPPTTDYHLLYRDGTAEGVITSLWREINLHENTGFRFIGNADRRVSRAVIDLIPYILCPPVSEELKFDRDRTVEVPYILLLSFILTLPKDFMTERRQFLIVQTRGPHAVHDPTLLFMSALQEF